MPIQAKGTKGLPYYGSGAHRVAGPVGELWKEAPRHTIDQGAGVWVAPGFSNITGLAATSTAGAVQMDAMRAWLHIVDTNTDAGEVFAGDGTGKLVMTTNDNALDMLTLMFNGGNAATGGSSPFKAAAGTTIRVGMRAKMDDATQSILLFGLTGEDTTPAAAVAEGIYLLKGDADTQAGLFLETSSVPSTEIPMVEDDGSTALNIADDTYFEMGFVVNGITSVTAYFNGHRNLETTVAKLPLGQLMLNLQLANGEAAAKTLTIERLVASQTVDTVI